MKWNNIIIWCCFLILISGCTPSYREIIDLPAALEISRLPKVELQSSRELPIEISLEAFTDERELNAVVSIKDQSSNPSRNVAEVVKETITMALERNGFKVVTGAPLLVGGEVQLWQTKITSGVPANLRSDARIFIKVKDPANRQIFSGSYEAFATREEINISNTELQKSLLDVMLEAVSQVLEDKELIRLLSSF